MASGLGHVALQVIRRPKKFLGAGGGSRGGLFAGPMGGALEARAQLGEAKLSNLATAFPGARDEARFAPTFHVAKKTGVRQN